MTKEYFENHRKKFSEIKDMSEIYYRKAVFYKHLYEITGLKWAKKKNHHYVEKAKKLLIVGLCVATADIAILDAYSKNQGE